MWGIVPAAGRGTRIQPLAFSKELLPVGKARGASGAVELEQPRAVSELLLERMLCAGAERIGLVIAPGKIDILHYYGATFGEADLCYLVQPRPVGLCDAIFRAVPVIEPTGDVLIGLPDTVWFPRDGFCRLPAGEFSLLTFPVASPERFDAVIEDDQGCVRRIEVKREGDRARRIWGAVRMPGTTLRDLCELWLARARADEYLGTLINAYIAAGGRVRAVHAGASYVDVGTLDGYREAISLLHVSAGTASHGQAGGRPERPHSRGTGETASGASRREPEQ